MNRRTLAIGLGMAAFVPSMAAGQAATPTAGAAGVVLRSLLTDVIAGGDYSSLDDIAGTVDPNQLIEAMADIHRYAERGVDPHMIAGDDRQAMAVSVVTDSSGTEYTLFLYIAIDDSGGLTAYRWAITREP